MTKTNKVVVPDHVAKQIEKENQQIAANSARNR